MNTRTSTVLEYMVLEYSLLCTYSLSDAEDSALENSLLIKITKHKRGKLSYDRECLRPRGRNNVARSHRQRVNSLTNLTRRGQSARRANRENTFAADRYNVDFPT